MCRSLTEIKNVKNDVVDCDITDRMASLKKLYVDIDLHFMVSNLKR